MNPDLSEWDLPIFHGEAECPVCHFGNVMFHVDKCWVCGRHSLVFCPRCRRVTCIDAQQEWDYEGGIR